MQETLLQSRKENTPLIVATQSKQYNADSMYNELKEFKNRNANKFTSESLFLKHLYMTGLVK
jgi:hypothetical protein